MDSRLTLHEELCKILGSRNVYFNTPESVKMKYPAIRYSLSDLDNRSASNEVYIQHPTYSLILIDKDPDSPVAKKLSVLSRCRLSRPPYPANGLYHFPFTLKTTNGNISDVLTEQYNQGYADCEQNYSDVAARVEQAYEDGKKAEYDRFWDAFQSKGTRTDYGNAFAGWTKSNFKPKYDIKPSAYSGQNMFKGTWISDLKQALEDSSGKLDCSNMTYFYYTFSSQSLTHLPVIDMRKCVTAENCFLSATKLVSIEKLIFENMSIPSTVFQGCSELKDLVIEGTIRGTSTFQACTSLSAESAKSIINALVDYSGTDKEFTYKITFSSNTKNWLNAEGANSPNGNTWLEYAGDKGWNY